MTTTTQTPTTPNEAAEAGVRARIDGARQVAGEVGGALGAGGKAYVAGVLDLGRALGGFGREILTEAGEHVRATVRAKDLRELAELQAAFAQRRIEMSATYTKEFADLARAKVRGGDRAGRGSARARQGRLIEPNAGPPRSRAGNRPRPSRTTKHEPREGAGGNQ